MAEKVRLTQNGLPMATINLPEGRTIRKNAKKEYKKPLQAATKKGINIGKDRARAEIVQEVFEQATLLSVVLGYQVYNRMSKLCDLNKNQLRVFILIGSFISLQKNNMKFYGFGSVTSNKRIAELLEMGYIQETLKMPISYCVTVKGRKLIDKYEAEYQKQMKRANVGVKRKSQTYPGYNPQQRAEAKLSRQKIINSKFKAIPLGRKK